MTPHLTVVYPFPARPKPQPYAGALRVEVGQAQLPARYVRPTWQQTADAVLAEAAEVGAGPDLLALAEHGRTGLCALARQVENLRAVR